ncbi:MAG: response regulator transcription factor [Sutterellaceae bacterium]|nr:response regulator transcription factor [Sutterellaceae bacterium]
MTENSVLLVEDDPMIAQVVKEALVEAGATVDWAQSGWEATGFLSQGHFDMVLVDLGLPGKDGMSVLTELRQKDATTPVIILTARDGLDDRLAGLDAGADDYILKPFHISELLARMRAVLRRRGGGSQSSGGKTLSNGELTLNCETKTIVVKREGVENEIALSRREYDLMEALLTRPGAILSRATLEDRLYGNDEMPESNALEFIIHGLRKKLGAQTIGNVRGLGWMVQKAKHV